MCFRKGTVMAVQVLIAVCIALPLVQASIVDKLRDDPDLSQKPTLRKLIPVRFYSLLEQSDVANATLSLRSCTLFVPTNEAFQKHRGHVHILYHITTKSFTQNELPKIVRTDVDGGPPLYITKNRNGDIFVNNARIIPSLSVEMTNSHGKRQVMHVIDEVLIPLTTQPNPNTDIVDVDALQFLQQSDTLEIGPNRVRTFRTQMTLMRKESLYKGTGGHTFFIPIDEGFKKSTRSSLVDSKVIDGHVVLNNVLFTSAAPLGVPQTTAAFEDNLKVTISLVQQDGKLYARSNTMAGVLKHSHDTVMAEIVKANIPLTNGVAHLIQRPLMIVDTTVTQFLEENENGALKKLLEVIMESGGEVLTDIQQLKDITILAPSNQAWNNSAINNIIRDRKKMRDILNMHIIKDRLSVEKIRSKNKDVIPMIPTRNNNTFLYFNIKGEGSDQVVTVEGGGVNATILEADIAQTDGYVHIIDRVLGVPYTTVLGKLETDPMMSDTFKIGQFSTFNAQLNNTQRRYTYFVPRDKAWNKIEVDHPSVHKKLFMRDFSYHSQNILQRHLVIADRVFTMDDLLHMTAESNSIVLPTYRDTLKIRVTYETGQLNDEREKHKWTGYVIAWNNLKIHVYRPDVECTNGIIHVLDYPLLEEKDIVLGINSGGSYPSSIKVLFANILMLGIARLYNF